jgi:hypothetical protein
LIIAADEALNYFVCEILLYLDGDADIGDKDVSALLTVHQMIHPDVQAVRLVLLDSLRIHINTFDWKR